MKLYMFRTVPLSIIRSFSLYTQQWYMSYRFADSLWAGSGWNLVPSWSCCVWHIPLLCIQGKTPDDGQRNCPKHIEFNSKNKFEKLVHLTGLLWEILKDDNTTFVSRNTNQMQFCNRIYYSKVFWRLNMFRAAHRSSSGALNYLQPLV